ISVRIEKPSAFTPARMRRPSFNPGPRYAEPLVRLALSNEALKTNSPTASRMPRAIRWTCSSLSITHGPAISTSGRGAPWARPNALNSIAIRIQRLRSVPDLGARPQPPLPVFVSGADERLKQRMRLHRLALELGVELAAQIPGVIGDLANLDVGVVRRFAGQHLRRDLRDRRSPLVSGLPVPPRVQEQADGAASAV